MNSGRRWPGGVLVGFGIANMLYALVGLYCAIPGLLVFYTRLEPDPQAPYIAQAFLTMTSINIVFLVCLVVTGLYLIRRTFRVILFCNVLFALEIVYFFGISMLWLHPHLGPSIGAATGIGNMGIALQIMTGYPIIALIVLNIAGARHRTVGGSANAMQDGLVGNTSEPP